MMKVIAGLVAIASGFMSSGALAQPVKPTIVLVHGAFAGTQSWDAVIKILERDGYTSIAVANPLRSVKSDAQYLADIVATIKTPVVLVGHSYGGSVISEAVTDSAKVKGLVFVSAIAPEAGETVNGLASKFPGSTLGPAIGPPVPLSGGGKDLYVEQVKFPNQFAADLPLVEAKALAATQRPVTEEALNEPSTAPAWKKIPSWFVYGSQDKNIPPQASAFMAQRAGSRQTVVVKGASHLVMVSNPEPVAQLIKRAATAK